MCLHLVFQQMTVQMFGASGQQINSLHTDRPHLWLITCMSDRSEGDQLQKSKLKINEAFQKDWNEVHDAIHSCVFFLVGLLIVIMKLLKCLSGCVFVSTWNFICCVCCDHAVSEICTMFSLSTQLRKRKRQKKEQNTWQDENRDEVVTCSTSPVC